MKLGKTLVPLEPLKRKINVIDGLFVTAQTGQGIHPAQTGSLLCGARISKGAIIHSGISVDQMTANRVDEETRQSSIVLACDQPMTGYHESNFSLAYSSHISWQTPASPVPVEVTPRWPGTTCSTIAPACRTQRARPHPRPRRSAQPADQPRR